MIVSSSSRRKKLLGWTINILSSAELFRDSMSFIRLRMLGFIRRNLRRILRLFLSLSLKRGLVLKRISMLT